jgi:hypothetical protein
MSTITVIMEPAADGTLHLPVPAEWRHQRIRVKAEMEPIKETQEIAPAPSSLSDLEEASKSADLRSQSAHGSSFRFRGS